MRLRLRNPSRHHKLIAFTTAITDTATITTITTIITTTATITGEQRRVRPDWRLKLGALIVALRRIRHACSLITASSSGIRQSASLAAIWPQGLGRKLPDRGEQALAAGSLIARIDPPETSEYQMPDVLRADRGVAGVRRVIWTLALFGHPNQVWIDKGWRSPYAKGPQTRKN